MWILNSFNPEGKTNNNINKEMESGKLRRTDTAVVTEGQRDVRREGTQEQTTTKMLIYIS